MHVHLKDVTNGECATFPSRLDRLDPSWLNHDEIPSYAVALRVLYQHLQEPPNTSQHHGSISCMRISSRRCRGIAGSGLCTVTGSSDDDCRRTAENISSNGTAWYVSTVLVTNEHGYCKDITVGMICDDI